MGRCSVQLVGPPPEVGVVVWLSFGLQFMKKAVTAEHSHSVVDTADKRKNSVLGKKPSNTMISGSQSGDPRRSSLDKLAVR